MLSPGMQDLGGAKLNVNAPIVNEDFTAITRRIDVDYNRYASYWEQAAREAQIVLRLEAGDPTLMLEMYPGMVTQYQRSAVYNHTRPLLCTASGSEQNTRKRPVAQKINGGSNLASDQQTDLLFSIWEQNKTQQLVSDAFYVGPLITGQAWIASYLNFDDDPVCGDVKHELCPQFSVWCDPNSREPDASDASFIWRRSMITLSEACILVPEKKEQIMNSYARLNKSRRFTYMSQSMYFRSKNLIPYDEYYYRDYREVDFMVDQLTGEKLDVTKRTKLDIEAMIRDNPRLEFERRTQKTVRLAILVNDEVVYDGPQPSGLHSYPLKRLVGYFQPDLYPAELKIQGLAKSLVDPQLHFNRRMMLTADHMEATASNGWMISEDSVVDIKSLFQPGPGRLIIRTKGTTVEDVQQIPPPAVQPGSFEMQEFYGLEMHKATGIYEEMAGASVDRTVSGYLAQLRQKAAQIALQPLFTRVNDFRQSLANLTMELVRANYTPWKIRNMLDGQEPAPLFYDKDYSKYQIVMESSFDTDTAQREQFMQLYSLAELGIPIKPEWLIETGQLQHKDERMAEMKQQEEQKAQLAQMQAQIAMQEIQSKIGLADSRSYSDRSQGDERYSRIGENIEFAYERHAKAQNDQAQAYLNLVKAMNEAKKFDHGELRELIEMQLMVNPPMQLQQKSQSKPQRSTKWMR